MLTITRRFASLSLRTHAYSFSTYQKMKQALAKNLYSIQLINKQVNRRILAMAYSPGVGAVCQAVQEDPIKADIMTLRARSVAVVTDGKFLGASPQGVGPAMDWIVAQIKYYSGLDPFPFIIEKDADWQTVAKDLAISYGTIIDLDGRAPINIPQDLLVLNHQEVVKTTNAEVTDLHKSANVLGHLVKQKIKGYASQEHIKQGMNYEPIIFKDVKYYDKLIKDGRDVYTHSLELHQFYNGKIHVELGFRDIHKLKDLFTLENLKKLAQEEDRPYSKTSRLAAIVTDGTAVLGYGDIGPRAGLPVMEGKSLLFKLLGDVDVVPVCIYPRKTPQEQVVDTVRMLGNFDAINLEDIKAPECFDIEEGLKNLEKLPVFHDDQHGTAIVTLAGLINAVKVVEKDMKKCKVVINGAGAAGITIAKLLLLYGVEDVIVCDSKGAIYRGRKEGMNEAKRKVAEVTNLSNKQGKLQDVIPGTDIFVGVSIEKALRGHWVSKMAQKSIVFALANPIPEILPEDAKRSGAWIYGSGRSDFQNQINNSLVFPGIFKGISEHRISKITDEMKIKAAKAIAASIEGQPTREYIIPDSLDKDVAIKISNELGKIGQASRASATV